jgi:steroid 5-alpha reductase family enzyme
MLVLIYLAHCAVVVFGAVTAVWLISLLMKDASVIDIFWGFGFSLVGATCLWMAFRAGGPSAYLWLMGLMPVLWGLRLTAYLARRNLGHGEDRRYVAMRKRSGLNEMAWRRRALFTIFFGQGLLILIVSAPVWVAFANGKTVALGPLAIIGGLVWLAGVLFEAIGDGSYVASCRR